MDAHLLDDLLCLPEVLIPDTDTLRMLASCYLVCKEHFPEISDASTTQATWHGHFRTWQKAFHTLLQTHRNPQFPLQQTTTANCGTVAWDPATQQSREHAACFYLLPVASADPVRLTGSLAAQPYLHVYTLQ